MTFHNQRDFIFVRHHRYVFEEVNAATKGQASEKNAALQAKAKGEKAAAEKVRARLQELGPRFTLRLRWLQAGTFDTRHGEYEWIRQQKMYTSRRRFFL